jgi:DNA polymerase-3 subunit gamma/tau
LARNRDATPEPAPAGLDAGSRYTVVARRYRPQTFEEVVGQDHVVQALRNAILLGRVTHAYLFSGTRGVGKTSIARIFAKCLNCEHGPTVEPCNRCDICQAIAAGQDVDVIEIDGASNNGVEQVRELRQNASLRPSRSRYKIYYIDEVHMLSTGAFNALLKTLEEPPEHVKFFFATTEPNKIPITVLSRCQRYDFAGIRPGVMVSTLAEICRLEGVEAETAALATLARRAAGSMRDAQSLLEQLLSYGGVALTEELVHEALGLAPTEAVLDVLEALAAGDSAAALTRLDQAVGSGVQPADLLASLLEFLRDAMVLAAGAEVDLMAAPPAARDRLLAVARRWPLDAILAAMQILAEARARMRGSPHGRLLVELALCRAARLEDFEDIASLIARLDGLPAPAEPAAKKKVTAPPAPPAASRPIPAEPPEAPRASPPRPPSNGAGRPAAAAPAPPSAAPRGFHDRPLSLETLREAWSLVAAALGPLGKRLAMLEPAAVPEPDSVLIGVPSACNWAADLLSEGDAPARVEAAFREVFGRRVTVRLDRAESPGRRPEADGSPRPAPAARVRHEQLEADPLVQEIVKLFDARPVRIDAEDEAELG